MKSFNVTLKVTGCCNCPYNNERVWCAKLDMEYPTPGQVYKDNVYKLTETCPMVKELKNNG